MALRGLGFVVLGIEPRPRRMDLGGSGGSYGARTQAASLEHLESYLKGSFNFIGIEPEFVAAHGLAIGPEQREAAIGAAMSETIRLAA